VANSLLQSILTSQFEAALAMLGLCVEAAPEEVWHGKVARYPFSQTAFHTLFFTDVYLGLEPAALKPQLFHQAHLELFGDYEQMQDVEPVGVYTKEQIKLYLDFCREKAVAVLAAETEGSLAAMGRFGRAITRAETHLYNIRHIQHHAAQLILRLRQESDIDIPWVGSGWREAPHRT
jgi:hypothetical protein